MSKLSELNVEETGPDVIELAVSDESGQRKLVRGVSTG